MPASHFDSLGLSLTEKKEERKDDICEVKKEVRSVSGRELVAYFSRTTRTSNGEEILGINFQFIKRVDLTPDQTSAITEWLGQCAAAAF